MKQKPKKREKVGKVARDLLLKKPETTDPIEIQREVHKDYVKNLLESVETGKKKFQGDFYIVVIVKNERLMSNVFRNYFFPRSSCPTPEYDQSVYFYNKKDERIEYLWTVPDKYTCEYLKTHRLLVVPAERQIKDFALAFLDGSLLRYSKRRNKEAVDSNIIVT